MFCIQSSIYDIVLYIVIILLLIYLLKDYIKENYINKDEKANTIFEWFNNNPSPKYAKYQKEVIDSDIVEYSTIKQKSIEKSLTKQDVLNSL